MASEKQLMEMAKNINMNKTDKWQFIQTMRQLRGESRKLRFWTFMHDLWQFIFFFSLLMAAMSAASEYSQDLTPWIQTYLDLFNTVMGKIYHEIYIMIPFSFPIMVFCGYRRSKWKDMVTDTSSRAFAFLTVMEFKALDPRMAGMQSSVFSKRY